MRFTEVDTNFVKDPAACTDRHWSTRYRLMEIDTGLQLVLAIAWHQSTLVPIGKIFTMFVEGYSTTSLPFLKEPWV